jgi:hypothetical protein
MTDIEICTVERVRCKVMVFNLFLTKLWHCEWSGELAYVASCLQSSQSATTACERDAAGDVSVAIGGPVYVRNTTIPSGASHFVLVTMLAVGQSAKGQSASWRTRADPRFARKVGRNSVASGTWFDAKKRFIHRSKGTQQSSKIS